MNATNPCRKRGLALLLLPLLLAVTPEARAANYVVAWGDNTYGQISVPPGITNATAVTPSGLILKADGTVVTWNGGVPTPPPGLTNIAAITGCLALRSNGTVVAWGDNTFGTTNVPPGLTNVAAIASGALHNLVLLSNGVVVQWGYNAPVPADLTNVAAIHAQGYNSIALRSNGTAVVWGYDRVAALPPPGLSNLTALGGTTAAVRNDGTAVCWGDNSYGQTNVPAGLTNVVSISTSGNHVLAVQRDGTLVGWGQNTFGQATAPPGLTNVLRAVAGSQFSLAIVSMPDDMPVVVQHPASQTVDAGTSPVFLAAAEGKPSLECQWQWNGQDIPGATNRSFWVSNAVPANAGDYRAIFRNAQGTAISSTAILTVKAYPPSLKYPLQNQSVLPGDMVSFAPPYAVPTGSPPLTYQWLFNEVAIPGATSQQLTLLNVRQAQEGFYTLRVSNPYGSVTSTAFLNVLDLGEALNTTNLIWMTSGDAPWFLQNNYDCNSYLSPMARSGTITNNQTSRLQTSVRGPGKLTFWWMVSSRPEVDVLSFSLNGSAVDWISGTTPWSKETYYLPAGDQDLQWGYRKTQAGAQGTDAGWLDYVSFAPGTFPPVITAQPASTNLAPGSPASFSVQVDGAPPFTYQWQFNGSDLAGATNSSLILTGVQATDNGSYRVVVSNFYGSMVSSNAVLNAFSFVGPAQPQDALDRWYLRDSALVTRVRFVGGLFIGLGNNGTLLTSPDGTVWTPRVSGTTAALAGVACGNPLTAAPHPLFVVVGAQGTILTSADGITWAPVMATSQTLHDVAWNGTRFVASTAVTAPGEPNVLYSSDGTNWSGAVFPNNPDSAFPFNTTAVGVAGNYFITAGGSQFAYYIWRSSNGSTWQNVGFSDQVVDGIASGNSRTLMVGWEGWPCVSANLGASWTAAASDVITTNAYQPPNYSIPMVGSDIAFGNGTFLVTRNFLRNGFLTTPDGATWNRRPLFLDADVVSVAYGAGTFVVACAGGTYPAGIYQSEPMATPVISMGPPSSNSLVLNVSGEIGRSYRLQSSADLRNWNDTRTWTHTAPTVQFLEPAATATPRLFYRVISP